MAELSTITPLPDFWLNSTLGGITEEQEDELVVKNIKVIVVSVVSCMVITTNILNIIGWSRVRHIAMATRAFLINLSVSDLCVGIIACAPSTYPAWTSRWPYGDVWCQVSGIVHGSSVTVSIWSISLVSIDRFCAVTWPLKYSRMVTKGRCGLIILGLWVCALVSFLAPCLTKEDLIYYRFKVEYSMCGLYWEYAEYCAITGFYIPIFCGSVLIFTAVKIVQALRVSSKFQEASGVGNTRSANRKALKVIVATSIIYFIFWGPYVTQVVAESLVHSLKALTPDWLSFATLWLANSNSGINVFVYSMTNAGFRAHLLHLLLPCRHETGDVQESTAGDQETFHNSSNGSIRTNGRI
jgi:hypothetical protein